MERLPWAKFLQRTFELDVLPFNKCGGRRHLRGAVGAPTLRFAELTVSGE